MGATVYHVVPPDYELTAEDVESIFANPDGARLATHPPIDPVGGQLYLFDISANPKKMRQSYRRDMFQWCSAGCHKFGTNPTMQLKKNRNFIRVGVPGADATQKVNSSEHYDRSFARYEFWDELNPHLMLLHYMGDATQFPRKRMTLLSFRRAKSDNDTEQAVVVDAGGALLLPPDYPQFEPGTELLAGNILYDMHHDGPNAILTHEEANDILLNVDPARVSTEPPLLPIGGMMFLYNISSNPKLLRAKYRCDQYQFMSRGCRINVHFNIMKGHHYIKVGNTRNDFSRAFARFEYWSPAREDYMLVHYVGDHTVWVPRPHGNSKKTATPYVRTQPEVLHAIKMQASEMSGRDVYEKCLDLVSAAHGNSPAALPASKVPRNMTQVLNHRRGMRRANMYENSGQLLLERAEGEPQFLLEDGTPVTGQVVKLSDGTYALIEGADEHDVVDEEGNSVFGARVVYAPDVASTSDAMGIVECTSQDAADQQDASRDEHRVSESRDQLLEQAECDAVVLQLETQINRIMDMTSTKQNMEALRHFATVLELCEDDAAMCQVLGSVQRVSTPSHQRSSSRIPTEDAETVSPTAGTGNAPDADDEPAKSAKTPRRRGAALAKAKEKGTDPKRQKRTPKNDV